MQLEHAHQLQKAYFYEHSKYSDNLEEIGFTQEKLTTNGADGKANYQLEVVNANATSFVVQASAVVDFNGNGTYNVWEIDQDKNLRETQPD